MVPFVICLSGRIGSGKTSTSTALASARGAAHASFGTYVRSVAAARGLDSANREILQNLGAKLIEENGHEWLCREVLAIAGWKKDRDLVIDGVRHVAVLDAIKPLVAPATTVLVHLALNSESELRTRGESRGLAFDQRAEVERHSTERDVQNALPRRADLVLAADQPVEAVVAAITSFLDSAKPPDL